MALDSIKRYQTVLNHISLPQTPAGLPSHVKFRHNISAATDVPYINSVVAQYVLLHTFRTSYLAPPPTRINQSKPPYLSNISRGCPQDRRHKMPRHWRRWVFPPVPPVRTHAPTSQLPMDLGVGGVAQSKLTLLLTTVSSTYSSIARPGPQAFLCFLSNAPVQEVDIYFIYQVQYICIFYTERC